VQLLSLADDIRGFGPVKEAAMKRYRERVQAAEGRFSDLPSESMQSTHG
jgi:signal transduction histidine kinase